jgi:hypothetical protein
VVETHAAWPVDRVNDQVQTQPVAIAERVGPLVSPWTLEEAAVQTLRKWLWPSYVEEVERQNGLAYQTLPEIDDPQIRGAAAMDEWMADELPVILVVCEKPVGAPESYHSNGYVARYTMTVGAVTLAATEDEERYARRDASLLAAACMGAIGQQLATDHPGMVVDVMMDAAPEVEPVDTDIRTEWQAQVGFEVTVCPVLDDTRGLDKPTLPEQTPSDYPEALTTSVTVDAVPVDS